MKRTSYRSLLLLVAALASSPVGLVHGQPARTVTFSPEIGDGAASCAETKTATGHPSARVVASVASSNLDVTFYHLDLTPDLTAATVAGTVRVEGDVVVSPLSVLTLDLAASMTVSAVALADGTPLGFTHPGAALQITLPAPVAVGAHVAVDVTYGGTPLVDDFGNFVFGMRTGGRFAWSLSEPYGAREWWPCKDHPSDKADSVRVTVTVPSVYRVGS
jgi:aminopeptidase N